MRVTEVTRERKHLVKIVTDEQAFCIDEETFAASGVKIGDCIDTERVGELMNRSAVTRAKNKALWLLSQREYSKKQLTDKLMPDFGFEAVSEALEILSLAGAVDDERYARLYARELSQFRGLSSRGVVYELIRRGIDRQTADEVTAELDCDDALSALKLIRLKYANFENDDKVKRRMYAALGRKGYGFDSINKAVSMFAGEEYD